MQSEQKEKINQIESNLHAPIRLADEKGKNIFDRMRVFNIPDICITVFDGVQTWTRMYSQSNNNTNKVEDKPAIFQAGSISKTINAVLAIKLLIESGKMNLDEDVNPYLKDWKIPGDIFNEKVTLRRLLSHTAGLSVSGFRGYPSTNKKIPTLIEILKGNESLKNISIDEYDKLSTMTPEGFVNTPPIEIVTKPGGQMSYSGGGMLVVQKLIEDLTSESYAALAKKHIFEPLGMTSSSFEFKFPSSTIENVKKGHDAKGQLIVGDWLILPELAAAGLWTTSSDLAKFFIAIQRSFCGETNFFLSQKYAKQILTRQPNSTCGLGFFLFDYGNETAFGHSGYNEGYVCDAIALANKKSGVIIMTNSENGYKIIDELMCTIFEVYAWPGKPYKLKKPITLNDDVLTRCRGEFVLKTLQGSGKINLTIENEKLYISIPHPHITSETTLVIELTPESNTAFFSCDNNIEVVFSDNYNELSFAGMKANRSMPIENKYMASAVLKYRKK